MSRVRRKHRGDPSDRLLWLLTNAATCRDAGYTGELDPSAVAALAAADLVARLPDGGIALTQAGRAKLARLTAAKTAGDLDPFRRQHAALSRRAAAQGQAAAVTVNDAESPLAWLARRKGRDGRPMIEPVQLAAGERLRSDFTFAQLVSRMTVDWASPIGRSGGAAGRPDAMAETVVAARQRLRTCWKRSDRNSPVCWSISAAS